MTTGDVSHKRVALPRLDRSEIGDMGQAFERMREALEGKQYVEQYVQSLTHEIKSPLSAIRGAAELLGEDMPADLLAANCLSGANPHPHTDRYPKSTGCYRCAPYQLCWSVDGHGRNMRGIHRRTDLQYKSYDSPKRTFKKGSSIKTTIM